MKTSQRISPALLRTAILAGCLSGVGVVHAEAGRVLFVSGQAGLERNGFAPLQRGMAVEAGDIIVTGSDGRVQLLMQDGDRIALRPDTRFAIDEFSGPDESSPLARQRPSSWRSFYSLFRGGFRTLTHSLGQRDESSYRIRTPVATIGIRGTDYAAYYCATVAACDKLGQPGQSGLFMGVSDGSIWSQNGGGGLVLQNDQYGHVAGSSTQPQQLLSPPPILQDPQTGGQGNWQEQVGAGPYSTRRSPDPEPDFEANEDLLATGEGAGLYNPLTGEHQPPAIRIIGQDGNGNHIDLTDGAAETPPDPPPPPPPPPPDNFRGLAFATAPLGGSNAFSSASADPDAQIQTDGNGQLVDFIGAYPLLLGFAPSTTAGECVNCEIPLDSTARYQIGSAENVDTDADAASGLKWGRWTGGTAVVTPQGGPAQNLDLTEQSLHWIMGPEDNTEVALPITGTYEYALVGSTSPTDGNGNTGTLGFASFAADFSGSGSVSSAISIDFNEGSQGWSAFGSGSFGPGGSFHGSYDQVNYFDSEGCSDSCSGSGRFDGFFTPGGSASAPPPGAGMTYALESGGNTATGAAAFGDPVELGD